MRSALEVMTDLAQSGLTAEQVALVMELSATVAAEARPIEDKQAQRRRERDRRYQAERRQNRQTSADSDDLPSPQSPPLKTPPNPQKITPPLTPQPPMKRACRLPGDWWPEPLTGKALAMTKKWAEGELSKELAKFKNYWMGKAGKDAVKLDWQRTWINWLISADERKPRNGRQSGTSKLRATLDILSGGDQRERGDIGAARLPDPGRSAQSVC